MSKNVIRLTESDIHRMVMEAVNEYRRGGYINPDGNSMTGGSWEGHTYEGKYEIYIDKLFPDEWFENGKDDQFLDYFYIKNNYYSIENNNNKGYIPVYADIDYCKDYSVGYEGVEFRTLPGISDEYNQIINECPFINDEEKHYMLNKLQEKVDSLEEEDFKDMSYMHEPDEDIILGK